MTIQYGHGLDMFKLSGSVFPSAAKPALMSAALTLTLNMLIYLNVFPKLTQLAESGLVFRDSAAWTAFASLVGFLIVFRTSQAYSRFWDGCTACHLMRAEWFDACSSLMAFCKHSTADAEDIWTFQQTLIRLFSMLHALALAEIEDHSGEEEHGTEEEREAFNYELIDVEAIDRESLLTIKTSDCKVELVFQWIQQLVVENISTGVLSIPPPILSRAFQEMANGMVQFHDAVKISTIPFPFPYAQACEVLLMFHSAVTPFVMCQWVDNPWWAFILSFTQVFVLWCLNFISREIQNPFGTDPNDIDSGELQDMMNKMLELLVRPSTLRTPKVNKLVMHSGLAPEHPMGDSSPCGRKSFSAVWHLDNATEVVPEPRSHRTSRISTVSSISAGGSTFDADSDQIGISAPDVELISSEASETRAEALYASSPPTSRAGRGVDPGVGLPTRQQRARMPSEVAPVANSPPRSPQRTRRSWPDQGIATVGSTSPSSTRAVVGQRSRGASTSSIGSLPMVVEVSVEHDKEWRRIEGPMSDRVGRTGFPTSIAFTGDVIASMDDTVIVGV